MLRKSAALRNYIIFCVIIFLLIQREIMSIQNVTTAVLLIVSILGTVSTLHYKNRLKELTVQKHINDKSTMVLVRKITDLAKDIRIATYPTDCDDLTKEIIGEECDLGNYMEWAGPHLEHETQQLLILLNGSQFQGER